MQKAIIGKKVGMTQIFDAEGKVIPVTVIEAGPCVVVDKKTVFRSSFNRPNLYYELRPKHNVDHDIIRFIKQHDGKSGIIYCLSRKKVEELAELLVANGIKALAYHAGMDAQTRADNQDSCETV